METMMKRGGERPRSSSYDHAEFLKDFTACKNSQQLEIPMAFVMEFGGNIHEKTTLKGYDGKLWNVNIEKTDEGVFVKNGWINFVNHYSLKEGEFLIFKYIGNSTFFVKIFGTNGCKIQEMPTPRNVREVEMCLLQNNRKVSKMIFYNFFHHCFHTSISPYDNDELAGSNQAQKVSSQFVKQEPVVTEEDPYFIKPVNYQQERSLIIPSVMFTKHKVKTRPEMEFCDEKGKKWPVKIHKCADGRTMFGTGWKEFWTKNNIRSCDTCKFTFLEGGSSEVIKAEILRGQAKK